MTGRNPANVWDDHIIGFLVLMPAGLLQILILYEGIGSIESRRQHQDGESAGHISV